MIESEYGPPFDNPAWDERKEEIKQYLDSMWSIGAKNGMIFDLWVALEAEEKDNEMLARHLAEIYDEVSGGKISKPNTLPSEVIKVFNYRLVEEYEMGWSDGKDEAYSEGIC